MRKRGLNGIFRADTPLYAGYPQNSRKPGRFRERLSRRNTGDEKLIGQILALDEEIRKLKQQGEALKSESNRASKEIGAIKAKGGDITEVSAKMKAAGDEIAKIDRDPTAKETELSDILLRIPNVNHPSVPVGKTAEDNRSSGSSASRPFSISSRSLIGKLAHSSGSSTSRPRPRFPAAASSSSRAPARAWSGR